MDEKREGEEGSRENTCGEIFLFNDSSVFFM